ncbi:MAG: hypothetical protein COB49_07490 [Alphaproteobacteria bacterium]|nr:MAG: hypothetical protein COB49_07490 [Alphaproteobacteria bacterium]
MIYDKNNTDTWPEELQDVMVWSPTDGRTLATFYVENSDGDEGSPGFGNWFNRENDQEYADYLYVTDPIEWWTLPPLESMS